MKFRKIIFLAVLITMIFLLSTGATYHTEFKIINDGVYNQNMLTSQCYIRDNAFCSCYAVMFDWTEDITAEERLGVEIVTKLTLRQLYQTYPMLYKKLIVDTSLNIDEAQILSNISHFYNTDCNITYEDYNYKKDYYVYFQFGDIYDLFVSPTLNFNKSADHVIGTYIGQSFVCINHHVYYAYENGWVWICVYQLFNTYKCALHSNCYIHDYIGTFSGPIH